MQCSKSILCDPVHGNPKGRVLDCWNTGHRTRFQGYPQMGDYTVREVLRRRSAETLRKIQQRRDQHKKPGESSGGGGVWLFIALLLLGPPLGYAWWVGSDALAQKPGAGPRNTQVYMRPLTLAVDVALDPLTLREELDLLGYRPVAGDAELAPGEFKADGDRVSFHARGFKFREGAEPPRQISASFANGRVAALESEGKAVNKVRIEPLLLGSIVPAGAPERLSLSSDEIPDRVRRMMTAALDPKSATRGAFGAAFDPGSLARRYTSLRLEGTPRPWARAADEPIVAAAFAFAHEDAEILEALVNEAHITTEGGREVHGLGLGASFLFGKPLAALENHQLALLVALVRADGALEPRQDPEAARLARDDVLDRAVAGDALVQAEADAAKARPLDVLPAAPSTSAFDPHLLTLVQAELMRDYVAAGEALPGGLRVFTSLAPSAQRKARAALTGARDRAGLGAEVEGALVLADHTNGELIAAVGGLGGTRRTNLAVDNLRPIGPLALPATYSAAMGAGFGPLTTVDDAPLEIELPGGAVWSPRNPDGRSHGREPLIAALTGSHAVALTRVALEIGVPEVVDSLRRLGAPRAIQAHPAVVGGEIALSPIEVAQMYATVLQGGKRAPLHSVRQVIDIDGSTLPRRRAIAVTRTGPEREGYLLVRALQFVARTATWRSSMPAKAEAAAMAGLDSGGRDAWAAGGDGARVVTVWFGRNEPGLTPQAGNAAAAVLGDVIDALGAIALVPERPAGVVEAWVDIEAGASVGAGCPNASQLAFPAPLAPAATTECRGGAAAALRRMMGGGGT